MWWNHTTKTANIKKALLRRRVVNVLTSNSALLIFAV